MAPSSVAESNGAWTVMSQMPSSADLMADHLIFVCQKWPGDFVLSAEVACTNVFTKDLIGRVGLFVRESRADPGGRFISLGVGQRQKLFLELRRASGACRESYAAHCGEPASWRLQLKRVGDVFEASFGVGATGPLAYFVTTELGLEQEAWVGFGVRSDGLDEPVRGVFKQVTLRAPSVEEARELTFRAAPPVVWSAAQGGVRDGEAAPQWGDAANRIFAVVPKTPKEARAPIWSVAALNGHPALRFDGTSALLAVDADRCPLGYAYRGTVVCVFQTAATNQTGTLLSCDASYSSDGLADDWSLSLDSDGRLSARFGFVYQWDADIQSQQAGLNDGRPHVAIFSWGGADRQFRLNVDGRVTCQFHAFWRRRAFLEIAIGGAPRGKGAFYSGGLAELALIRNRALTSAEEAALGRALAERYGADAQLYGPAAAEGGRPPAGYPLPEAVILRQPQDQTVRRGVVAEFEVVAAGGEFQWFCDGRPLEGLAAARIRVATEALPAACHAAIFECRVTKGRETVFSRKAALRVE